MAINVPPEEGPGHRRCVCIIFIALVLCLPAIIALACIFGSKKPENYYVAIDAVSGLAPATDLGKPALDQQVEFHLTIGVQSTSPFSSECWEPGASVVVAYQGVQIANGSAGDQACVAGWKPEQMVHMSVVANGTAARLPGSVLDSLAAEVRRGVALFDVSLRIPATTPGDNAKLVVCRGRRVGGVVQALLTPCEEN